MASCFYDEDDRYNCEICERHFSMSVIKFPSIRMNICTDCCKKYYSPKLLPDKKKIEERKQENQKKIQDKMNKIQEKRKKNQKKFPLSLSEEFGILTSFSLIGKNRQSAEESPSEKDSNFSEEEWDSSEEENEIQMPLLEIDEIIAPPLEKLEIRALLQEELEIFTFLPEEPKILAPLVEINSESSQIRIDESEKFSSYNKKEKKEKKDKKDKKKREIYEQEKKIFRSLERTDSQFLKEKIDKSEKNTSHNKKDRKKKKIIEKENQTSPLPMKESSTISEEIDSSKNSSPPRRGLQWTISFDNIKDSVDSPRYESRSPHRNNESSSLLSDQIDTKEKKASKRSDSKNKSSIKKEKSKQSDSKNKSSIKKRGSSDPLHELGNKSNTGKKRENKSSTKKRGSSDPLNVRKKKSNERSVNNRSKIGLHHLASSSNTVKQVAEREKKAKKLSPPLIKQSSPTLPKKSIFSPFMRSSI